MQGLATRIEGPVAVIGDLHGQVDQLLALIRMLQSLPDYDRRWIVFIGDFVDRGPDPKGVLDVVTDLLSQHPRTTCVCGNHDLAMMASLDLVSTPDYTNWAERWLDQYEADTTFASYGADFGALDQLRDRLPSQHGEFLRGLPWCVEHPNLLFVHAGLDPNSPFEIQLRILREKDFTLSRPPWLCSKALVNSDGPRDCPLVVVSGHVRVPQVVIRERRILVDTTGGVKGELSGLLWPEKRVVTSAGAVFSPTESTRAWWKLWK